MEYESKNYLYLKKLLNSTKLFKSVFLYLKNKVIQVSRPKQKMKPTRVT